MVIDTLTWQETPMMGWTKHHATTSSGYQYTIEKEDDCDFVLFLNGDEIGGGSSVRAAKSAAQSHHEKLTMKERATSI